MTVQRLLIKMTLDSCCQRSRAIDEGMGGQAEGAGADVIEGEGSDEIEMFSTSS
jgi:hypothetical protein